MKYPHWMRAATLVALATMLLTGCGTPSPMPSQQPSATPPAIATAAPSPSATPAPKPTSVDLGVPAGDVYNVLTGALDVARGLVYAVAVEGDARADGGAVSVVDLKAQTVKASAPLPVLVDWMPSAALSADGTRLYVVGRAPDERQVAVVVATDAGTRPLGEVLGTVADVRALALDGTSGQVYVAGEKRLRRLDAVSLEQRAATDLPDGLAPNILLTVNPRAERVYICDSGGNAIFVYRADDLAFVGALEPGAQVFGLVSSPVGQEVYAVVQAFTRPLPVNRVAVIQGDRIVHQWDVGASYLAFRLAVDDKGTLFVLEDGVQDGVSRSQIRAWDTGTGAALRSLALPYMNLAYSTPLMYEGTLLRLADVLLPIALATGEVGKPMHLGVSIVQMALDEDAGLLYALDSAGVLHVVDTDTMAPVHAWQVLDTGLDALREGRMTLHGGRVYVADIQADRTLVLDAATGEKLAEIPKAGQVSVDESRKRLFVTSQGVFIADMTTYQVIGSIEGTVRQQKQLYSPGAVETVYDPTKDWLLVTMTNNAAGSGLRTWLDIYDAGTLTRVETPIQNDQRFVDGLALDMRAGRIWIAGNYPRASLSAWAADGRLLARRLGVAGRLFLDSARGRVYARAWSGLVAVDGASGDVVGFRPLSVRSPDIAVFDEGTGRFYITSANSATIQIVNPDAAPVAADAPGSLPSRAVRELAVGGESSMLAVVSEMGGASVFRSEAGGWVLVRGWFTPGAILRVMPAPGSSPTFFAFSAEGAYTPGGLYRTDDGGRTWQVSARGLTGFYIRDLALSPGFSADGTAVLLAGESGVFQTTDGGQAWEHVSDIAGVCVAASAGPVFMVLAAGPEYSRTEVFLARGSGGPLERVGTIPVSSYFVKALALSPDFARDGVALVAAENGGLFLSQDGGRTWKPTGPPLASVVTRFNFIFLPDFAKSRTVYALAAELFYGGREEQRLLRSTDGGVNWEQAMGGASGISCIALGPEGRIWAGTTDGRVEPLVLARISWGAAPSPTPTFTPPPPPTPAPTPTPLVPLVPPAGLHWPDGIFLALWRSDDIVRQALGWAVDESAHETAAALEAFEGGLMIWRADMGEVYALLPEGDWYAITDAWTEGQPESDPTIVPPAGRFQPIRGFGKVWRENPWLRGRLGWAVEPERGVTARAQRFEHGWLLQAETSVFVLVNADVGPAFWQRREAGP